MNFGFTQEQDELRRQARRFLDQECPLDAVRELMAAEAPHDRGLWKKMADLGWLGLAIPEAYGGLGLSWEDLIVVAEEMGRTLCPSPFPANTGAAQAILALGSEEQKARLLPGLCDGSRIATLALLEESDDLSEAGVGLRAEAAGGEYRLTGRKLFVEDGGAADLFLVAVREGAGVSLVAVPRETPGITVQGMKQFDQTKRAASVAFEGVRVPASERLGDVGRAWGGIARTLEKLAVAFAAETVGAADAALAMSVQYAKVREQFGRPIGTFQGVKHRLAELYVDVESARSLAYYAAWAVENAPETAARHVAMAKAAASEAADAAGEECIQTHGAIGYTWECNAHLYYKRGRWALIAQGSADHHYDRVLRLQGL